MPGELQVSPCLLLLILQGMAASIGIANFFPRVFCEDAAWFTKHRHILVIRVENINTLMSLAWFDSSAVYSARRSELLRKLLFVLFSVLLVGSPATSVEHVRQKRGTVSLVFLYLCLLQYPSLCAVLSSVRKSRSVVKLHRCPQNRFKSWPFVCCFVRIIHKSASLVLCSVSWYVAPSALGKLCQKQVCVCALWAVRIRVSCALRGVQILCLVHPRTLRSTRLVWSCPPRILWSANKCWVPPLTLESSAISCPTHLVTCLHRVFVVCENLKEVPTWSRLSITLSFDSEVFYWAQLHWSCHTGCGAGCSQVHIKKCQKIVWMTALLRSKPWLHDPSAIQNTCRPTRQTARALDFRRDIAHFEVLHVSHAVDHVLRFLAEWIVRLILLQVGFQRVSIQVRFNLMNQLFFDCYFACAVFLFHCGWNRKLIVGNVSPSLEPQQVSPRMLEETSDFLSSMFEASFCPSVVNERTRIYYFSKRLPNSLPPLFQCKMLGVCCRMIAFDPVWQNVSSFFWATLRLSQYTPFWCTFQFCM